jgi:hypothetical protein
VERLVDHLSEDGQHLFFQLAMVVLQFREARLGSRSRAPHALEEHLHEFVTGLDLGVIEKTDEQAVTPGRGRDVTQVTDIEGRGFCGKLLHFRVGKRGEEGPGRQDRL